jgi:hypothetical protein
VKIADSVANAAHRLDCVCNAGKSLLMGLNTVLLAKRNEHNIRNEFAMNVKRPDFARSAGK